MSYFYFVMLRAAGFTFGGAFFVSWLVGGGRRRWRK